MVLSFVAQDGATEVDPLKVFYMADYHLNDSLFPITRGRLSAHALDPPYPALLATEGSYVNGALALDPLQRVLYGNRCCPAGASLFALDARTLEVVEDKSI